MKKYLVLASVAAITAAACTKEQVDLPKEPVEISYQVVQKAPVTKADYPTTGKFSSWAFYVPADKTWADNQNDNDVTLYISGAEISYVSNTWKDQSHSYFWPNKGTLTFFAVSPSTVSASCDKNGLVVSDFTVASTDQVDLMVADCSFDQKSNTSTTGSDNVAGVPTVFRHKLTNVCLAAQTVGNDGQGASLGTSMQVSIKSWKISGVKDSGKYTYKFISTGNTNNVDDWAETSGNATYEKTGLTYSVSNSIGFFAENNFLLPQSFSDNADAKITVSYTVTMQGSTGTTAITYEDSSEIILKDIGNSEWGKNKKVTYLLKFKGNEIFWDPQYEDWDATDGNIPVTVTPNP